MHPTGFEPAVFVIPKMDYESSAFNHSATDAKNSKEIKIKIWSLWDLNPRP